MARTITLDAVEVTRLQLFRDAKGEFRAFAEYSVKAGAQTVQARQVDLTERLSPARKAAALAAFDAIANDLRADELS